MYVGVVVSVPAMISFGEEEGNVLVCATLTTAGVTERGFTIFTTTRNGLGAAKISYM